MLDVCNMSVSLGGVSIVQNFSLQVSAGTTTALVGPSGSGKTTILQTICGVVPMTSGSVSYDGVDITNMPIHLRKIGMVFQNSDLFSHLSVWHNIAFGLRFVSPRLVPEAVTQRVQELLHLIGMDTFGDRRINDLSGGEQRRVALARALAPRPHLLLLDEPFSALDSTLRWRLIDDVRDILSATQTTALIVTHDQQEADALATHTVSIAPPSTTALH
ncbi:MAG: ABC transporter ATP-binding protein [Ilumatobacteraceae bacterium]|nr:ABC transporter ATP-binding protein [Ilumatobacteraceae bacterium]